MIADYVIRHRVTIYMNGDFVSQVTHTLPLPPVTSWTLEPTVIEPDEEPEDDTGAEVPDVREDRVPDDTP